ncbi:unnamed protein product [Durusdinium trenchii]|uniref:Uncharacterized protein n=2 Tax=Durusdinium trenchii TaxID=1381693 RepID=A0ABP0P9R8_9DINO
MPDGGWKPVDIEQFLISGIKPVLVPAVAGATSPTQTKAVWVRQLQKDDSGGFEFVSNAFQIDPAPSNIDYLKRAIQTKNPATVQCDAFQIDMFSQQEDGNWSKEEKMSASLCDTCEDSPYGYIVPQVP